ncbi:membrane-bound transcription factor site-2 protease [Caerostris extrusa]|uniref:Membrane-bound transcription factor site-2 protease n=1 Tax=Caerostris extrusa TaxID=172846 RepID=A0AAV4RPX6_CAEEX|nr:membrane-bound transcription factor site-2 protease [Caerostris extrusa]
MAFVALNTEQLKQLTKSEQLCICSAGVWHNMVLCFSTCLLVLISPVILKPFYEQGHGITVVEIQKGTGLDQKGGLMINDVIVDVNECPVKTMMDWENCLNEEYLNSQSGFCVSEEMYKKENSVVEVGSWNCCQNTSEKMCFRHSDLKMSQQLMCLPVRKMTEKAEICKNNLDCREKLCLVPVLDMNSERLLRIGVYSRNAVYYIGGIESFSFVSVGRWIAKTSLPVKYVDMCEMFIGYIFAFSSGIAIINIIPLFCLDGNYIIECIIHLFLKSYIPISSDRNKFIFVLKVIGHVSLIACGFSVLITYYF